MRPACLTIVALIAAGASSTGGLAAIVLRTLPAKGRDEVDLPSPPASWEHRDRNDEAILQEIV